MNLVNNSISFSKLVPSRTSVYVFKTLTLLLKNPSNQGSLLTNYLHIRNNEVVIVSTINFTVKWRKTMKKSLDLLSSLTPQTIYRVSKGSFKRLPGNSKQRNKHTHHTRQNKYLKAYFLTICKVIEPFRHGIPGDWYC